MTADCHPLSPQTAQALLDTILPGSTVEAIGPLPGSYSNYTHVVDARSLEGTDLHLVIRRYAVFGQYDRGAKARREFKTFELLARHGIPAPEPLFLDETGDILGIPGIVTRFVKGQHSRSLANPQGWARTLATMLARIHAVPCDADTRSFLLDANAEASWFARSEEVPDYMGPHPDGATVWRTVRERLATIRPVPATLVHVDYWPGNVLWDGDRIAAVIDWEEAAYGDPAIDVAYCRMCMFLDGLDEAAETFLRTYESASGKSVANLGIWELAAAARPLFSPQTWEIALAPKRKRFSRFIRSALKRVSNSS